MIVATVSTALFHYTLDHDINWMSFPRKHKVGQVGKRPHWRYQREGKELSTRKPKILDTNPSQDDALSSPRPVIWIPMDNLGISHDEICHTKRTYNNVWISNKGASLNEEGKLILRGTPPETE
jgi:hypothetical protein